MILKRGLIYQISLYIHICACVCIYIYIIYLYHINKKYLYSCIILILYVNSVWTENCVCIFNTYIWNKIYWQHLKTKEVKESTLYRLAVWTPKGLCVGFESLRESRRRLWESQSKLPLISLLRNFFLNANEYALLFTCWISKRTIKFIFKCPSWTRTGSEIFHIIKFYRPTFSRVLATTCWQRMSVFIEID